MQAGNLLIGGVFDGLYLATTREIFARNLRFWLKRRGLSGAELSRRLDISPGAVSHWLRGFSGPELTTVGEVAAILDVPAWYLLHEGGEGLPDGARPPTPKGDEAEKALKTLGERLGFKIRIEPIKKP